MGYLVRYDDYIKIEQYYFKTAVRIDKRKIHIQAKKYIILK